VTFIMLQKCLFQINAVILIIYFFLIHQKIGFHENIFQHIFSWAANQHIRMISEGSCDTEDWSNDAENSALHHRNKLQCKMYSNLDYNNILQYYSFYSIFDQIKLEKQ